VDWEAQPPHQRGRRGREGRQLPASEAESVAECAIEPKWVLTPSEKSSSRRGCSEHTSLRTQGVRGVRVSPSRASHRRTEGRLIMH